MRFSAGDTKRRAHLGSWLPAGSYPTSPALLQCCLLLLTSPGSNVTAFAEFTHLEAPCALPKLSISPPEMVTLSSFLYLLWPLEIPFTFSSPSYFLDQILVWQVLGFGICVVIDCLAGKTRQLAVELLQQFVTTQIYSSPQCHKTYRNINLGGVYCFVKFFDQQVWKLCGWQNTDIHPHKLTVWSQWKM